MMPIRLPHVSVKTVSVPCKLDADLYADLEAYAAVFEAERGDPIPLPTLIATIVEDYLQHDPDFIRQRRQAAAARARPKPPGPERRNGAPSPPTAQGESGVP
ncbi:MAG: DUF2274 domain-containing protein [Candidatus Tectimicrobiota bacterium]